MIQEIKYALAFVLGFLYALCFGIFSDVAENWNMGLYTTMATVLFISSGCILYSIVCFFIKYWDDKE